MALHESPIEPGSHRVGPEILPGRLSRTFHIDVIARDRLLSHLRVHLRGLHPLVMYRLLALVIAVIIIGSNLHAESSIATDWQFVVIASVHVGLTAIVAPGLGRRPAAVIYLAILLDGLICILLLASTYGWRGPFWLYSISAVFWPAYRFSLRGVFIAVTLFDVLVLLTNVTSIRETIDDGFGGDLLARMLTIYVVAGAIMLTTQSLTKMRLFAAESERNRIARNLHDGVGKTMGGISMEARSLEHWIERDPAEAQRRAHIVARISERAANEVRDVIRGLRRTEATDRLFASVRQTVEQWEGEYSIPVHLQLNGQDIEIPILLHTEIMRMLGELLSNIARHSNASEAWVRVTLSSAGATLAVRDNGDGFDSTRLDPWADDGHFGLLGAHERVAMLGGRFRTNSTLGNGTEVTIDLPLTPREELAVTALH